jgi:ParB family transcriptional regulator, chromosome partitioning protein
MSNLKIVYKPTTDLIPYANNSRTHSDDQVLQIASSIKEFGFTNPVLVDDEGGIVAGHGRVMAAKKLNLKEVPTITLIGLTEAQKKAYIIADNKLALNAGWDDEMLKLEFDALKEVDFDLEMTGFNLDELLDLNDNLNFEPATEDEQGKLDELDPKWISCPHCGKEFDARQS